VFALFFTRCVKNVIMKYVHIPLLVGFMYKTIVKLQLK